MGRQEFGKLIPEARLRKIRLEKAHGMVYSPQGRLDEKYLNLAKKQARDRKRLITRIHPEIDAVDNQTGLTELNKLLGKS